MEHEGKIPEFKRYNNIISRKEKTIIKLKIKNVGQKGSIEGQYVSRLEYFVSF